MRKGGPMENHSGQGGANAGKTTSAQERRRQYFAKKNAKKKTESSKKRNSDLLDFDDPNWDPFS